MLSLWFASLIEISLDMKKNWKIHKYHTYFQLPKGTKAVKWQECSSYSLFVESFSIQMKNELSASSFDLFILNSLHSRSRLEINFALRNQQWSRFLRTFQKIADSERSRTERLISLNQYSIFQHCSINILVIWESFTVLERNWMRYCRTI